MKALNLKSLLSGLFMSVMMALMTIIYSFVAEGKLPEQWLPILYLALASGVSYLLVNLAEATFWETLKNKFFKGLIIGLVMGFLSIIYNWLAAGTFPVSGEAWTEIGLAMAAIASSYWIKYFSGITADAK